MSIDRIMIQKIGLALSIIIVLNLFFNYGIYSFYPTPKYEDFCSEELSRTIYDTRGSCEGVGGTWIERYTDIYGGEVRQVPAKPVPAGEYEFKPYCDPYTTCSKNFRDVETIYNRNVFIALVILGGLAVLAGFFTSAVSAVSNGLLYGGLISFFIGSVRYWSDMNEYLRFIILGIVLIGLIAVGYKKLSDKH